MKISIKPSRRLLDRFLSLIESVPGSDKLILRLAFFAVVSSVIWLLFTINQQYSEQTAVRGGSITEGIIGTPRFVNPALAITRADQDVTALVYSGLMKIDSEGNLVNDLAESITTSDDGLTYNIVLRQDVSFHDGTPLTAKDVIFTIQLIQNPDLKSPLRGNWSDVTLEEVGEYELNIVLKEPYAPFIENFTLGIMPAHSWSSLPVEQLPFSQLNTEPIGSGSFAITKTEHNTSGLIKNYTLTAYRKNNSNPKIDTLELDFYQNEDDLITAVQNKMVDATAYISAERVSELDIKNFQLINEPLPRTFGIFFNQNRSPILRDSAVRQALTVALNKDELIEKTLFGYGIPINGPTPLSQTELESMDSTEDTATSTRQEEAIAILKKAGWIKNNLGLWEKSINGGPVTLSITLRTSNAPLFGPLANTIIEQWEAIGVEVVTEQFEQTGLVQSVIRPRDFEALLFGLDMSRTYDLYPFWHSSQQDDPGLNIAQYANVSVDALLEEARTEQNIVARNETLTKASEIIENERPAIFLFQPNFTYLVSKDVTVVPITNPGRPADRFSNIDDWHTESDSLWPIFQQDI
ncbi:ABC transporter substrate-binding protein [Candidatus Nomurabacteria bacterium]|nr:ABC transporter substrate-binding protein [Candidatus Nomurabacteria bacterium]